MNPNPDDPRKLSPTTTAVALVLSALLVTSVIILIARRAPVPQVATATEQQQWESANHDRLAAMKREAEGLVLENNLREAGASIARSTRWSASGRSRTPS